MGDSIESGGSDNSDNEPLLNLTCKRKSFGRVQDAAKAIRNHTYETGKPCGCKRFNCFNNITNIQQKEILRAFNAMHDRNEQNNHLCGLISLQNIKRRRPRNNEMEARLRDNSFTYKVRVLEEASQQFKEIQVCQLAFMSLHGITNRRLITLKGYLQRQGGSCHDKRGTHQNRPHKLSQERLQIIHAHIKSFKGRKSHYSLKDSRRIYLSETLNVKKMYRMYAEENRLRKPVAYETYRNIFLRDFNIGFGYPRSDTCSSCDATKVQVASLESKLTVVQAGTAEEGTLKEQLKQVETADKLHKLRAAAFYKRKRLEKKKSRKNSDYEAITMDYCKNLQTPNITTNDVYYKRQLTFVSFNIHVLSTNQSVFYTYPQTIAKKGADEVMSLLYHFCTEVLSQNVRHLRIFCDSCAGQNKNFTLVRFVHYLIHGKQRFDSIEVIFPMRGHSYMESDKDFGLINQKSPAEVPSHWVAVFKAARCKPQPFDVYECTQEMFHSWTKFLSRFYRKSCPFPTRPIQILQCSKDHPRTVAIKETAYNAPAVEFVIRASGNAKFPPNAEPDALYHALLPIPKLKYQQLQDLKVFISEELQSYYDNLPQNDANRSDDEFDLDGRIHNVKFTQNAGGVARNIVDALNKLNCPPIFLSAIGEDYCGRVVTSQFPENVNKHIRRVADHSTAQCVIVLDAKGECKFLLGDVEIHKKITPDFIRKHEKLIQDAPLLVLDGNPTIEAMQTALEIADKYETPVLFEPTDVVISEKPFRTRHWKAIKYISPNLNELKHIAKVFDIPIICKDQRAKVPEIIDIVKLLANYIDNIIVTLGVDGLLIARYNDATDIFLSRRKGKNLQLRHYPAISVPNIISVSGAGDCLISGMITSMLKGFTEEQCVAVGLKAATTSLQSFSAVPERFLFNDIEKLSPAKYIEIF